MEVDWQCARLAAPRQALAARDCPTPLWAKLIDVETGQPIQPRDWHVGLEAAVRFKNPPLSALIIKRPHSTKSLEQAAQVMKQLLQYPELQIYVEAGCASELSRNSPRVKVWPESPNQAPDVDVAITVGGDGTVLWTATHFLDNPPAVLSFNLGSLGYLTQYEPAEFKEAIKAALRGQFRVSLRQRLACAVYNALGETVNQYIALNECVIDRGFSSFITTLDVYYDNAFFTTVQADGLILATPTGSTAYSLSAGGSVVHPKVGCILFSPICPHTLSFRPLILPDTAVLRIRVPLRARASAWLAVDGQHRTEISRGSYIEIAKAHKPFPLIVPCNLVEDRWLGSLKVILNWNYRQRQAPAAPHAIPDIKEFLRPPDAVARFNRSEAYRSGRKFSCDALSEMRHSASSRRAAGALPRSQQRFASCSSYSRQHYSAGLG